ncbi:MAG: aspartate kinase, partial [Erysipelotrichaceae bacterium]
MKVVKFGGSSLADAHQFKKVKDIILSDEQRKVIVVSAPGKRFKSDNKITDLLYLCHAHVKYGVSYDTIFNTIKERFEEINEALGLGVDLDKE